MLVFDSAAARDGILAGLRDGTLSWAAATASAFERHEFTPAAHWTGTWSEVDDATPVPDPIDARVEAMQRELDAAREQLRVARLPITDVMDERLTPIWDKAAEAAEENGFCSEYDKLCDSLGIPGRVRLYRGVVTVTLNVYAYAEARNADDAGDLMEQRLRERVRDELATEGGYDSHEDGSVTHVDINSSEYESVDIYS